MSVFPKMVSNVSFILYLFFVLSLYLFVLNPNVKLYRLQRNIKRL